MSLQVRCSERLALTSLLSAVLKPLSSSGDSQRRVTSSWSRSKRLMRRTYCRYSKEKHSSSSVDWKAVLLPFSVPADWVGKQNNNQISIFKKCRSVERHFFDIII